MLSRAFLFSCILHLSCAIAVDIPYSKTSMTYAQEEMMFEPWFTGPLLAGAAHTIPAHHTLWEPYIFVTGFIGGYDQGWKSISTPHSVSISPLVLVGRGLTNRIDIQTVPQFFSNFAQGAQSTRFADLPVMFSFQLMEDVHHSWKPDVRLLLKEIFPTGHYQHLDPNKNGTDSSGFGAFQTGVGLNIQKLYFIKNLSGKNTLLRGRLNFSCMIPSSVNVHGFNTYGGGFGTKGQVKPGSMFFAIAAIEYMFSQNWVGAIDIQYLLNLKSTFSGTPGTAPDGSPASVGVPINQQINLAPALEYNFNANVGFIFGLYFSIAGQNAARFVSGVIALNYYH